MLWKHMFRRALNIGANLMTLVLEGRKSKDGILQREDMPELVGALSQLTRCWKEFPLHLTRA